MSAAKISLDKEAFFRRIKRIYSAWKVMCRKHNWGFWVFNIWASCSTRFRNLAKRRRRRTVPSFLKSMHLWFQLDKTKMSFTASQQQLRYEIVAETLIFGTKAILPSCEMPLGRVIVDSLYQINMRNTTRSLYCTALRFEECVCCGTRFFLTPPPPGILEATACLWRIKKKQMDWKFPQILWGHCSAGILSWEIVCLYPKKVLQIRKYNDV